MPKAFPVTRSADGRSYVCAKCGVAIPDGAKIQGNWDGSGVLLGVRALGSTITASGQPVTVHVCATGTPPAAGTAKWSPATQTG